MTGGISILNNIDAIDLKGDYADIKELNARIERIVENENRLRAEINAIIKELEEETA